MRRLLLLLSLAIPVSVASKVSADLEQINVLSLEWLVDSSDVILIATAGELDHQPSRPHLEVLKMPEGLASLPWPWTRPRRLIHGVPANAKLLLFGRGEADGTFRTHYCIFLTEGQPPDDEGSRVHYYVTAIPRVSYSRPYLEIPSSNICLVFDARGQLITRPADLLNQVKRRIRSGSRVPADCRRDLVERGTDAYGGFRLQRSTPLDHPAWVFSIGVPPEPEFRAELLLELRSDYPWNRQSAAQRLVNYPDREVEKALIACLSDEFICEYRGHVVREAAAESLKRIRTKIALDK